MPNCGFQGSEYVHREMAERLAQQAPKIERDLVWIVQVASALSLGTLAALLYSIRTLNPSIQFRLSMATPIAFAIAALASVAFWHVVFRLSGERPEPARTQRQDRAWLRALAALLALGLIFAFVYPLREFSSEKVSEIGFGAFIAVGFLSILALLFWRVVRYLES